ncbi:MAG TPA: hypothetical protein VF808_13880 [Ktedonobacterales bacterium]
MIAVALLAIFAGGGLLGAPALPKGRSRSWANLYDWILLLVLLLYAAGLIWTGFSMAIL